MRITAGRAKGLRLQTTRRKASRPTANRVKEALFNSLGANVLGAEVLDLFAGTGGLGMEALSRGASHAVFVEKDPRLAQLIRQNVKGLGFSEQAEVWQADVFKAISTLGQRGLRFSLILLDPPYGRGLIPKTLERIARAEILAQGGVIVAEGHWRDEPGDQVGPFRLVRRARYGETALWFYGAV